MSTEDNTGPKASQPPEFRWPTAGDQAFIASGWWAKNAHIDPYGRFRAVMMIEGYKMAADLMVAQVAKERTDGTALVFPIIFNYRQFIELGLKFLIAEYGHIVGIGPQWNTHDLKVLWATFVEVLNGYGIEDEDGTDAVVGGIIAEFTKVDPRSFSYRYPVDTKGKLVELALEEVDLYNLYDVMKGLENYFNGYYGYLDNMQD